MKTELRFQELRKAVAMTERVAGKHMTLPVLSCLLFEIKKNSLVIKATNLDIGVEVHVAAKSEAEETVAVPAAVLSSFLGQIAEYDGVASLEISSGNMIIQAAKSRGVIKTVPHEDFPSIPVVTEGQEIIMSADILIKGLKAVWYSASLSSVKPELSSVYMYTMNNELVFVATDSFRLAEKRVRTDEKANIKEILIPFKNIADMTRILETLKDKASVYVSKNMISFEVKNKLRVVSRVIDGIFPDYKQIIPKGYVTEVVVLKQDLLNALKISNVFSDKFNQVHFTLDPKGKLFEIQTKNSDIGENKTAIDAAITGEKIEINFNYKYIVDCFQSIDADSMTLQLSGMNRPMVIRPVSGDQSFMYLVMPMNR
ncbi:MAG: DNA polymerase III subunit beta [Candidatus Paceibacterota bacterium]